jgi:hypothetical protein
MRISIVVTTLMPLACVEFSGCAQGENRLPRTVTTAAARDFNEGDALRTASNYTDDAQILPPRSPVIEGKPAIAALLCDEHLQQERAMSNWLEQQIPEVTLEFLRP